jgi:polysaccharide pyruvyl transferase WcaK-like protein
LSLLAPFGFYGWGNIGDEATLQGFARLVAQSTQPVRVWVGSRNPQHTARVEPSFRYFHALAGDFRRTLANYVTSGVVVAGGTPIMDCHGDWPLSEVIPLVEQANRRGKPTAFVGSGTEHLQLEASRRLMAERLVPLVRYWTVRSEPDEKRLIEYGVEPRTIRVAADLAWLLDPVSPDWGRRQLEKWGVSTRQRLVGVNLVNEKQVRDRHPRLFDEVGRFLDQIVEDHDASIVFLANDIKEAIGFDRAATMRTLAAMKHRDRTYVAPNDYWAPQKMMSLIANCDATISMRYHFCLFSALQGVPFIALQRSDKVADLCWDLRWRFGADLDSLRAEELSALFAALDGERQAATEALGARIPILRDRACANMTALETVFDGGPRVD